MLFMKKRKHALLSKCPLTSEALLISEAKNQRIIEQEKILVAETERVQKVRLLLSLVTFSWWGNTCTGFAYEWLQLEKYLAMGQQTVSHFRRFKQSSWYNWLSISGK